MEHRFRDEEHMSLLRGGLLALAVLSFPPQTAEAQGLFGRARDAVKRRTDEAVTGAIECALGDTACADEERAEGREVVYVDDEGDPTPGSVPAAVGDAGVAAPAPLRSGEGAWANYDFVPGERPLYVDDFSNDRVGNFPRRLEFVGGSMEVVEWQGQRWIRDGGDGAFFINLPETLPGSVLGSGAGEPTPRHAARPSSRGARYLHNAKRPGFAASEARTPVLDPLRQ